MDEIVKRFVEHETFVKFAEWKIDCLAKVEDPTAIGGRFTYSFTPTSLGIVISVRDDCTKDEINLTEYHLW